MKRRILFLLFAIFSLTRSSAQNIFKAILKDSTTMEVLKGVSAFMQGSANKGFSDSTGYIVLGDIPNGTSIIIFGHPDYETVERTFSFPIKDTPIVIYLIPAAKELEEVIIVEGTRSNKSIADIPTRVEVLTEEIDEASTMDPSKIAHLITHSTGIQVQQTSATSNTANVRIQGLDGRYTQILKDGFPLYGGFSGSLSIMQIPPLDLRQVEYIKGGASTLYGGGAISGLINLISKEPDKEETLLHINGSHIGAFDVNAFVSKRVSKIGFTLLGQRNVHRYLDADKDGYTDLPQLVKYNLNPKLFFYFSDKTKLSIGSTLTNETRQGGDVDLLNNEYPDSTHFYKEKNDINRITTQTKFEHKFTNWQSLQIRNSFNFFHRNLEIIPTKSLDNFRFAGQQVSSFSEIAYKQYTRNNVLITGLNFYTDRFREDSLQSPILRHEEFQTVGGFVNYTFDIGKMVILETGMRGDFVLDQKFYLLPRISALFKWTRKLTTRIGGGMGYRNATIFNQEAELLGYRNVLSIDRSTTHAEESYGGNVDIGFKTKIGKHFSVNFNQMFFYTHLNSPLVLRDTGSLSGIYNFINANGYTQSFGAETFFKFGFYNFVLFIGYTYTNATNHFNGVASALTLTPRHSLKGDLLYAIPGKWRIGLDYEFKGQQYLNNGKRSRTYWTYGAVVEYTWNAITLFGNVENYTNIRQTKYESLLSGPNNTPQFTDVWAPLDGIVFNGGIKIRL